MRNVSCPVIKKGKNLKAQKAYELEQPVVSAVPIEFFACD